jgi:hypothetical protein
MRFSSRLSASSFGIALMMCGAGSPASSQTATSVPSVTVEAPTVRPKSKPHVLARSVVRDVTPTTTVGTVLSASIPESAKLAKLATLTGSCVGGCATSFRTPNTVYRGCSLSSGPMSSVPCRNIYGFKTYEECRATSMLIGWRPNDIPWYCSSLALK